MRLPSASASRPARASRFRVQRAPVRHDKKSHPIRTLVAVVPGAVGSGVSFVTSLLRRRR